MTLQPITTADVAGWNSLEAIADTLGKRGLKPQPNLSGDNTLVLQLADDEFMTLIDAGPGESATDFKPHDVDRRHTNLVATNDYDEFTFITRVRTFGQQHGQIKHQKLTFSKSQFTSKGGEKNTILQKLNELEYGSSAAIYGDLYDTKRIVKAFYEQFEALRTDLVQEVTGIPDDRGDAKGRYVQVTLDRMIFLYFIQEKRLLDRNPDYLHEHHEQIVADGEDVYVKFYEPLFFELLAEGKQDPHYGSLPYLNGGLFSTNPIEEDFPEARLGESVDETNELFGRILSFLSNWNWNVDERLDIVDPKNLSPAVLGHIFEQTVNQKEMGAYYTPEEITGFMARRSIQPYLLDQLNEAVGADYGEIDEVFGLAEPQTGSGSETAVADGGTITQQAPTEHVETEHVETLYFDILQGTRVLDPAVGSGAFLLAAQDVLLDVYLQCLEFFEQLYEENQLWSNRARGEIEQIHGRMGSTALYAKRQIILHNLYGVDIDDGAVEICKLRLWLSMVADIEDEPSEVEPLPNIDFNIRRGNTLIGFTELIEVNEDGDAPLSNYGVGGESVRRLYEDVIEAIERHQRASSASEATNARKLAESRIDSHSSILDEKVLKQFRDAGLGDVTGGEVEELHPFHWVLEFAPVYNDGGFDIVIGNPPWEVLTSDRDEYFTKYDPEFRKRPKFEKDTKQEELLRDETVSSGWKEHQEARKRLSKFITNSPTYKLQSPDIGGQGKHDLSALFLERIFNIAKHESYVSLILPNKIYVGTNARDLRDQILKETALQDIITFENKGIFDIDDRQKFGIISFKNSGSTDFLRGKFLQQSVDVLKNIDETAFDIPLEVLKRYSPRVRIFPQVESLEELNLINKIIRHPSMSDESSEGWYIDIYKEELNRTRDSDRFVESESEGDYPVYGGGNIWQFEYDNSLREDLSPPSFWSVEEEVNPELSAKRRIRGKDKKRLKTAIYNEFDGSGSQVKFVDSLLEEHGRRELSLNDVLLDCSKYRIVFREISNSTNERSFIASIIPPGIVCHHKAPVIRPHEIIVKGKDMSEDPLHNLYDRIFNDRELFVALGLMNSTPFDYLVRTKLDTSMSMHVIEEAQLPRLTNSDNWFDYISNRAAQLNCYGDEFEEMRERLGGIEPSIEHQERHELQAEIDAAAFHAYGLDEDDTKFVLDDFHRVGNPRLMTEEYFVLVFEKYRYLAEEGPLP